MKNAYTIEAALKGRGTKTLRCASAWVAFEQYSRLVRKGLTVRVLDHAKAPVTDRQLEALARVESGAALSGSEQPAGLPISTRNLLMG